MKKKYNQIKERNDLEKRNFIKEDFLKAYSIISNPKSEYSDIKGAIKNHKKIINSLDLNGKKKYKTLHLLNEFYMCKDRNIGLNKLENYINNKNLFNKFI